MISRLDLDGVGSPLGIAARIHTIIPDLPTAVPVEALCGQLDIRSISELDTEGFEAALIMDANKAAGGILVAAGRSQKRRRYSVAHELGHFLIPTHMPDAAQGFECSLDDLHLLDHREQDRCRRVEAEANRFAAALLMPVPRIRMACASKRPSLVEVVRLADEFDVSKEAMARSYVEANREAVAVILLRHGRIVRMYRNERLFPWIEPRVGDVVPAGSTANSSALPPGELLQIEECDADTWIGERAVQRVDILTEQLLAQRDGFAMLPLHAELIDEDDDGHEHEAFRPLR